MTIVRQVLSMVIDLLINTVPQKRKIKNPNFIYDENEELSHSRKVALEKQHKKECLCSTSKSIVLISLAIHIDLFQNWFTLADSVPFTSSQGPS